MAGLKWKSGAPARIQISVFPFGDERLVRAAVLLESNAMVGRMVRLGSVTELLHTREFRAQKMTFKAPICISKANPNAAGITVMIIISSTLIYEHSECQNKKAPLETGRVANRSSGV